MDIITRFETKFVKTPNACWEWLGWTVHGYGVFDMPQIKGQPRHKVRAHRFSYELYVGPIPEGLDLDHLCKNRICVNPDHLEPVTRKENLMRAPGNVCYENTNKTKCPAGHDYNEINTYRYANGDRKCRICDKVRKNKQWQVKKDQYNAARRAKYLTKKMG